MEGGPFTGTWVIPQEVYSARLTGACACVCGAVKWSYDAPLTTMLQWCEIHDGLPQFGEAAPLPGK